MKPLRRIELAALYLDDMLAAGKCVDMIPDGIYDELQAAVRIIIAAIKEIEPPMPESDFAILRDHVEHKRWRSEYLDPEIERGEE